MSEIYWLTRLDWLQVLAILLIAFSLLTMLIAFISYDDEVDSKRCVKGIKYSITTLVIGTLMAIFIPTTKEALAIWGIGETIEYIKSNDRAKELPDKCIEAIDKFINEYKEEEK